MTRSARSATADEFVLGEGPVWDPLRQRVLWVDIDAGQVLSGRMAADGVVDIERRTFGQTVGALAVADDGALIVAARRTLVTMAALDSPPTTIATVLADAPPRRLNDGKPDPYGRFVVGSLALDEGEQGREVLVRLEDDGSLATLDTDLVLSNGLGWSPDGTTMYSIDTGRGIVWTRTYDAASGVVGGRRALIEIAPESPDGMAVDEDGNLWIAFYASGQIRCFSPSGLEQSRIHVAVPNTTSCCFVGENLDRLLITAADGPLFVADPGVRGTPVSAWRGCPPAPAPPR